MDGVAKGGAILFVMLGLGVVTAGCGGPQPVASRSSIPAPALSTGSAPTLAVTTVPPAVPGPPTTAPSPGHCPSGPVAVAVSRIGAPAAVCIHTGATLTVTFAKAGGGTGSAGPWTVPPLRLDRPLLAVVTTTAHGALLTAVLRADTAGSTTVYAAFDQECSAGDATPCTIPPLAMVELDVTVVAP